MGGDMSDKVEKTGFLACVLAIDNALKALREKLKTSAGALR